MGEACFPAQTAGLVLLSTPNFLVLLDALVPLVLLSRLSTASIVAVFSRSEESKVRVCSDKVISRAVPAAPACLLVSGIFSNRGLCRLPQCTDFQMGFICNILAQLLRFSLFPFTAKERVPASGWHWLRERGSKPWPAMSRKWHNVARPLPISLCAYMKPTAPTRSSIVAVF